MLFGARVAGALAVGMLLAVSPSCDARAQSWYEPALGSAERAELLDAIRVYAVRELGPPIEFVVETLRVADKEAFAILTAQRPGGVPIAIEETPVFKRGDVDPQSGDAASFEVLYHRSEGAWAVAHWSHASTEVWFAEPVYCAVWRDVLEEVCG